jgi:hypothetical protein
MDEDEKPDGAESPTHLSRGEFMRYMTVAMLTALGLGLVFVAVFVLFTLFSIHVWLR